MDKQKNINNCLKKYRGVIFDLDGTIIDLGVDWGELKKELTGFCLKNKKEKIIFSPLDEKLIFAKKKWGKNFYFRLLNIVARHETTGSRPEPNRELIGYINNADQKFAIYSMNTKKCVNAVVKKYLKRKPDLIISKDNCAEFKPTGKDILKILRKWKFKKNEVIFVGNSQSDRLSGEEAGVKTKIISF